MQPLAVMSQWLTYCMGFLQVVVGGGQEASQVTTTAGKAGRFESRFFHKVSVGHNIDMPTGFAAPDG